MGRQLRLGDVWCRGDSDYVLDGRGCECGSSCFALGSVVDQWPTPSAPENPRRLGKVGGQQGVATSKGYTLIRLLQARCRGCRFVAPSRVRLIVVNDNDVLGHLLELVDQALTLHFGQDAPLIVVPAREKGGGLGTELRYTHKLSSIIITSFYSFFLFHEKIKGVPNKLKMISIPV